MTTKKEKSVLTEGKSDNEKMLLVWKINDESLSVNLKNISIQSSYYLSLKNKDMSLWPDWKSLLQEHCNNQLEILQWITELIKVINHVSPWYYYESYRLIYDLLLTYNRNYCIHIQFLNLLNKD